MVGGAVTPTGPTAVPSNGTTFDMVATFDMRASNSVTMPSVLIVPILSFMRSVNQWWPAGRV